MARVEATVGDITRERVDAIVNAANESLAPGGGVCGAIHRAAGPRLADACGRIGHCATGDAVATPGFDLPAAWVIHAVGPVWHGGHRGESDLLASCYRRSLEVAAEIGARSVAFPAISTGIFGYPLRAAAEVAVATVTAFDGPVDVVRLVCFDDGVLAVYTDLLDGTGSGDGGDAAEGS